MAMLHLPQLLLPDMLDMPLLMLEPTAMLVLITWTLSSLLILTELLFLLMN